MSRALQTDIAIMGGGASGLVAAIAAARACRSTQYAHAGSAAFSRLCPRSANAASQDSSAGAAVVILEKLPRVGKKLLATGNGRCNLGNLSQDPAHFHGSVDTTPVLGQFPGEEAFFRSLGVVVRPDEAGRLYPASGQAASVLDALRLQCAQLGVQEVCGFTVTDISPQDGGFLIRSATGETVTARRVILATGGAAGPQYGTSGEGFRLAETLGHKVTATHPALAPIAVEPHSVRALKGLRVQARVTALKDGQPIASEEGQVQFADGALSGICVFNLAALQPDALSLDLLPWCEDAAGLLAEIFEQRAGLQPEDLLTGLFPKRVGQALLKLCPDKAGLAALVKDWRFAVRPATNWEAAQVTAGGVTGLGANLESRTVPGLYFAGEIVDVHGDTGGFNLRWAWASGLMAGTEAARGLGL